MFKNTGIPLNLNACITACGLPAPNLFLIALDVNAAPDSKADSTLYWIDAVFVIEISPLKIFVIVFNI